METWDAIRARRNVRDYTGDPIAEEDLHRILEAGRRTPSSRNEQRWDFVVVTERDRLQRLAEVWRGAGHVARSAATIALVAPVSRNPDERESIQYDLGQVTMSIMLAAAGLGIGSAHSFVADEGLGAEILGLPDDRHLAWMIALGHPADGPLTPLEHLRRRDLDDVVHREEW